jgi:hypothetical protein
MRRIIASQGTAPSLRHDRVRRSARAASSVRSALQKLSRLQASRSPHPRSACGSRRAQPAPRQWSEEFDERPEEIATILVDRENGRPVRKLELHSQDERLLTSADTAQSRGRPNAAAASRPEGCSPLASTTPGTCFTTQGTLIRPGYTFFQHLSI